LVDKEEIMAATKKFVAELKKIDVNVKDWNVAVGKAGEATTLKISVEVDFTPKNK
jgi:hypothetical protein